MVEVKQYQLELHFDALQLDEGALQEEIAALLDKWLDKVTLKVEKVMGGKVIQVRIAGNRDDVAACHGKITHHFFDKAPFFRCVDEVGDELRQQAYPILAHIEHVLRVFINRAMVEVNGFYWWEKQLPAKLEKRFGRPTESDKRLLSTHHFLEWLSLNDLVDWVTESVYLLPSDSSLTPANLVELLDKYESVQAVKVAIEEKMRPISYWDEVFIHYFDDQASWKGLESHLEDATNIRNKVMHHRAVQPYELARLCEVQRELDTTLSMARNELPEEELREAQQASEKVSKAVYRQRQRPFISDWQEMADTVVSQYDLINEALGSSSLQEAVRYAEITERFLQNSPFSGMQGINRALESSSLQEAVRQADMDRLVDNDPFEDGLDFEENEGETSTGDDREAPEPES